MANLDALASTYGFAIFDGVGTFTGDDRLCVTQLGHTPVLSQWTTVSNFTQEGSPYLWWRGPDAAAVLPALLDRGKGQGSIGGKANLGIIAGDRASDQAALQHDLLGPPQAERLHPGGRETA